jgi:hypothetical protein
MAAAEAAEPVQLRLEHPTPRGIGPLRASIRSGNRSANLARSYAGAVA